MLVSVVIFYTLPLVAFPRLFSLQLEANLGEDKISWQKGDILGKGAYGKVYLGMNKRNGKMIAVKQVRLSDSETKAQLKNIMNEIELMKHLKHQNIVEFLGMDKSATRLNILLEYVPGNSLDTIISQFGALNEPLMRRFL